MKLGAADFLSKPFDVEDLELPPAHALKQRQLTCDLASLRAQLQAQSSQRDVVRTGERMAGVRDLIDRVSDTARHACSIPWRERNGQGACGALALPLSLRRDKPFVKVNCAPRCRQNCSESELFGFERGAFTGAVQHKPGRFEFANRGTIFLDEVGEMSARLQAKLLQVLQDGEFSRGWRPARRSRRMCASSRPPIAIFRRRWPTVNSARTFSSA